MQDNICCRITDYWPHCSSVTVQQTTDFIAHLWQDNRLLTLLLICYSTPDYWPHCSSVTGHQITDLIVHLLQDTRLLTSLFICYRTPDYWPHCSSVTGHQTTDLLVHLLQDTRLLTSLLISLDLFNYKMNSFSTMLVLELWRMQSGVSASATANNTNAADYSLRLLFHNDSNDLHSLSMPSKCRSNNYPAQTLNGFLKR